MNRWANRRSVMAKPNTCLRAMTQSWLLAGCITVTNTRWILTLATISILIVPTWASTGDPALTPVPAPTIESPLSTVLQVEIIQELQILLKKHYVLDDKVEHLIDTLQQAIDEGRFSEPSDTASFVDSTNSILQSGYPDRHLGLLSPARYDEMRAMFGSGEEADKSGAPSSGAPRAGKDPMSHHGRSPGGSSTPRRNEDALREIAGITQVAEISRDGLNQIGYIAFDRFIGSDQAMNIIARIFRTFTESERLIFDVRECRGGDADMVRFLSNYLFAEPTHLVSTIGPKNASGERSIQERWTVPNDLSKIFATKPVDVLISASTFSAGESFAFGLRMTDRARLFGETTGGGGHMNDIFPLPGGLGVSISVGRTYDPRTGEGWQATGVVPQVVTQPDHAMSELIGQITKESGKLAAFSLEERDVYDQLQAFTHAWYNGDRDAMAARLTDDFQSNYRTSEGVERLNCRQYLEAIARGVGNQPRVYHNRIISNIDINENTATAELVLRATKHRIELRRVADRWQIVRDDYEEKYLSR